VPAIVAIVAMALETGRKSNATSKTATPMTLYNHIFPTAMSHFTSTNDKIFCCLLIINKHLRLLSILYN